jgi:hypothetical protein
MNAVTIECCRYEETASDMSSSETNLSRQAYILTAWMQILQKIRDSTTAVAREQLCGNVVCPVTRKQAMEQIFSVRSVSGAKQGLVDIREGGFKYFHRSPASCRRQRKGNPVRGGITGPPCSLGI